MANVWHPYDRPAFSDPLCLMDMTCMAPEAGFAPGWEKTRIVRLPTAIDQISGLSDPEEPAI